MQLKPHLIIFSMSHRFDWEAGLVNRNFHIVQQLIRSQMFQKVVVVDFFPIDVRKTIKVFLRAQLYKKHKQTIWYQPGRIRVDQDVQFPTVHWISAIHTSSLPSAFNAIGLPWSDSLIWAYNPLIVPYMMSHPADQFVFDAVDNWLAHDSHQQHRSPLAQYYQWIDQHANAIFTVSDQIHELFPSNQHVTTIANGVEVDRFATAQCRVASDHHPVIGYHGVIQQRFDVQCVQALAEARPHYQIKIAGPIWKEVQSQMDELFHLPNVKYSGSVSYQQLPDWLACIDVGIIPHHQTALTASMNPLKLYEYLASGRPVVSTPVSGVDTFADLITIAHSPAEFIAGVDYWVQHDSIELQQQRRLRLAQHDWRFRVESMLDRLREL